MLIMRPSHTKPYICMKRSRELIAGLMALSLYGETRVWLRGCKRLEGTVWFPLTNEVSSRLKRWANHLLPYLEV